MEVDNGIESRRDNDNEQLEKMHWQVSDAALQNTIYGKLTRRTATPRLNICGSGSPRGL
jgi:hypothetical protein